MRLSTKTYTHAEGLSCVFRQWRAVHSHCSMLHGYALSVKFVFGTTKPEGDVNGWAMDFGQLKPVKAFLKERFDHTLCVAKDDPELGTFKGLEDLGLAKVEIWEEGVGCEHFAKQIYTWVSNWLLDKGWWDQGVFVYSVEVREHEGNSAIYTTQTIRP